MWDQRRVVPFFPPGGGGAAVRPGGVWLDQVAQVIGHMGRIVGAVLDERRGLLLIAERNGGQPTITMPPLRFDDLYAAAQIVNTDSPTQPAFSIDPDPQNPQGPAMRTVFYGFHGQEASHLAYVAYLNDWIMKKYTLGRDPETGKPWISRVHGYHSLLDFSLASSSLPGRSGAVGPASGCPCRSWSSGSRRMGRACMWRKRRSRCAPKR